jgi:lysozyme family protein
VYLDQIESSILADASASTTDPKGKGKASGAGVGVGSEMWRGRKLDTTEFEKMSAEQVGQLYELMHATKDVWKS